MSSAALKSRSLQCTHGSCFSLFLLSGLFTSYIDRSLVLLLVTKQRAHSQIAQSIWYRLLILRCTTTSDLFLPLSSVLPIPLLESGRESSQARWTERSFWEYPVLCGVSPLLVQVWFPHSDFSASWDFYSEDLKALAIQLPIVLSRTTSHQLIGQQLMQLRPQEVMSEEVLHRLVLFLLLSMAGEPCIKF